MKKLILLLTLTMMFGQTKLETRVYELSNVTDYNNIMWEDIIGDDISLGKFDLYAVKSDDNANVLSPLYTIGDGVNYKIYKLINSATEYLRLELEKNPYSDEKGAELFIHNQNHFSISEFSGNGNEDDFVWYISVTAEFPIEDTGYIEDGFDYCVEPGANLMSYPCDSDVALLDAIPADALSQFSGIIGQGLASVQLPNGTWVGSLTNMQASSGYWITSTTSLCFNYDCSEN
jgi:hypothetical protein